MKILDIVENEEDDTALLTVDLTDEEEGLFFDIGKKNHPDMEDRQKIIEQAMLDAITESVKQAQNKT